MALETYNYTPHAVHHAKFDFDRSTWVVWVNIQYMFPILYWIFTTFVVYFVKYVVFRVSAFWIQIAYIGLKLDAFVKIGKNVEIEYANPQKHIIASKFSDEIWWRHNNFKMADGRHIDKRFFCYMSAQNWPINA